jgi:hypothetical protein
MTATWLVLKCLATGLFVPDSDTDPQPKLALALALEGVRFAVCFAQGRKAGQARGINRNPFGDWLRLVPIRAFLRLE